MSQLKKIFDSERLILEIEPRKAIWDPSCDDYCDRDTKKQQWEEVVDLFGGEQLSDEEKEELEQSLKKKWKNIRSCYSREIRRLKNSKISESRKSSYMFFDQLSFLKNSIVNNQNTENSTEESPSTDPLRLYPRKNDPDERKKKRSTDDNEDNGDTRELIKTLSRRERQQHIEYDEDRMFLLSLLTAFKNIPENRKSAAKIKIISVIESFRIPQNTTLNKWWWDNSEDEYEEKPSRGASTSSNKNLYNMKRSNPHTSQDSD